MNSIARIFALFVLACTVADGQHSYTIPDNIAFTCPPCGCAGDEDHSKTAGTCSHCGMAQIATFTDTKPMQPAGNNSHRAHKKVAIFIFDGVQIIDFAGPYEVFGQAGMEVFTVGETGETIRTAMGMQVTPTYSFDNSQSFDILVLPGGGVSRHQQKPAVLDWVRKQVDQSESTLSVCNGAFFLAHAGLLDGKRATTFASLIPSLADIAPKTEVVNNERFVDNGKIVTSAGLSSGIDASLYVVSKYLGMGRTQEIATTLEYDWDPEGGYVRAALPDNLLRSPRNLLAQFEYKTLRYEGNQNHWKSQYLIKTDLPADKMMELIEAQLILAEGWKKQSQSGLSSTWSLDQEPWRAKVSLEKDSEGMIVSYMVKK